MQQQSFATTSAKNTVVNLVGCQAIHGPWRYMDLEFLDLLRPYYRRETFWAADLIHLLGDHPIGTATR
jgi:hypothetical protein